MAVEIERKFLVSGSFPRDPQAKTMVQAYIAREDGRTVRIRFNGQKYMLTIKGASTGIARHEFEFDVTDVEGKALLHDICPARIEKVRHNIPQGAYVWEIDVFSGENEGLIVAELELPDADAAFEKPDWLGPEVSGDERFFNAALLDAPFSHWGIAYQDLLRQGSA